MAKKPLTPGSPAWWTYINAHPQSQTRTGFGALGDPRVQALYNSFPGFTPYKPPDPAGSYDPALNAQLGASNRGFQDLTDDTTLAGTRSAEDYGIQLGQIKRAEQAVDEDYTRNVGLLTKNYTDLASNQADRANAYGVVPGGGAALQSAAKRDANQAIDRQGLDTDYYQKGQAFADQEGSLALTFDRGVTDRTTALSRAGRENTQFGIATAREKAYQAGQAGYIAPKPPKGQQGGVISSGVPRRSVTAGGVTYVYDQNGKLIRRKPAK